MTSLQDQAVGVVGAGAAGLIAARRLLEAGLAVEVVERRSGVGGLWHRDARYGGVYRSAHLISSKHSTELADFPMPADFPDYPSHAQVLDYLRRFADRYDLARHVTFGRQVERARPLADGGWEVGFDNGDRRGYAALVIASGHHWDPVVPDIPDAGFDGETLHAAAYDTPDRFAGRRVVVVGLGNSACDVAVDAVYAGAEVMLSVRGGNQIIPKYVLGRPTDRLSKDGPAGWLSARLPGRVRSAIDSRVIGKLAGRPESFGLPRPTHRLYERQPLINSLLPYHLGHGDIRIRPPVTGLRGAVVGFADGGEEKADVVVWCTGYRASVPFLDVCADLNAGPDGRPRLALNMFHPHRADVVAVGLIDPLGSWSTVDLQATLCAAHLGSVLSSGGSPLAPVIRSSVPEAGPGTCGPDRDWLFKDHAYTRLLRKHARRAGAAD